MRIVADIDAEMLADVDGHYRPRQPLRFTWSADQPAIVEMLFVGYTVTTADGSTGPVAWEIGRRLLAIGGGIPGGDVWVERDARSILIILRVDDERATMRLDTADVDVLIGRTLELVPFSAEFPPHRLDAFLADLLDGAR